MATYFSELPAELRATIWNLALQDELERFWHNPSRLIEFYDFDPGCATTNVRISRKYPKLFAVSREARYEAAKIGGWEWVQVHTRYSGDDQQLEAKTFEICINFNVDHIFLSTSFIQSDFLQKLDDLTLKPEQFRLHALASILDKNVLNKIQYLMISTQPPLPSQRLEHDSYWMGEGLELLQFSDLRTVTMVTSTDQLLKWTKLTVEDYLETHWVHNGWENDFPLVCGIVHMDCFADTIDPDGPFDKMLSTKRKDTMFYTACKIPTSNIECFNDAGIFYVEGTGVVLGMKRAQALASG